MELKGIDEAIALTDDLDKKMISKVVKPALRAGAKIMAKEAKVEAPTESGYTRKHIKVRSGKSRKNLTTILAIVPKADFVSEDKYYAGWVNFGHWIGHRKLKIKKVSKHEKLRGLTEDNKQVVKFYKGKNWWISAYNATQSLSMQAIQAVTAELIEKLKAESKVTK